VLLQQQRAIREREAPERLGVLPALRAGEDEGVQLLQLAFSSLRSTISRRCQSSIFQASFQFAQFREIHRMAQAVRGLDRLKDLDELVAQEDERGSRAP